MVLSHIINRLIILLFLGCTLQATAQQAPPIKSLIKKSVATNGQWDQQRYFVYSAVGNHLFNNKNSERIFLVDYKSGQCRLETSNNKNEEITVLFNYKTQKISKYYLNKEATPINDQLAELIFQQFYEDTNLLFFPALLTQPAPYLSLVNTKIINAEKISFISFSSVTGLDGKKIDGKVSINTAGKIKSLTVDQDEYQVSNFKDIGNGIKLATSYHHRINSSKSCIFSKVAAFTTVETDKFNSL